jgi:hypothetical protein
LENKKESKIKSWAIESRCGVTEMRRLGICGNKGKVTSEMFGIDIDKEKNAISG